MSGPYETELKARYNAANRALFGEPPPVRGFGTKPAAPRAPPTVEAPVLLTEAGPFPEPEQRPPAEAGALAPIILNVTLNINVGQEQQSGKTKTRPFVADVQRATCEHFKIEIAEMNGPRRGQTMVRARQVAMYLATKLCTKSLPELGRMFGGKDHSTVHHARGRIAELMQTDPEIKTAVEEIRKTLLDSLAQENED